METSRNSARAADRTQPAPPDCRRRRLRAPPHNPAVRSVFRGRRVREILGRLASRCYRARCVTSLNFLARKSDVGQVLSRRVLVDLLARDPYSELTDAPVAQLDRAMAYGAIGCRFDSCRVYFAFCNISSEIRGFLIAAKGLRRAMRCIAKRCGRLLRSILRRPRVGICAACNGLRKMVVCHLQVMLGRNPLAVADPGANEKRRRYQRDSSQEGRHE